MPVTESVVDSLRHKALFVALIVGFDINALVSVLAELEQPRLLTTSA